jgi:hypothetical protein
MVLARVERARGDAADTPRSSTARSPPTSPATARGYCIDPLAPVVLSPRDMARRRVLSPRPSVWRQGTPSRMSNSEMANCLVPASCRLLPHELQGVKRTWRNKVQFDWVVKHALSTNAIRPKVRVSPSCGCSHPLHASCRTRLQSVRKAKMTYVVRHPLPDHICHMDTRAQELSAERVASLKDSFSAMDRDGTGSVDVHELAMAMKLLGFAWKDINEAIKAGDLNKDGQLDFNEYQALIVRANSSQGSDLQDASNVPFALVANTYRISRLVDSYAPTPDHLQLQTTGDASLALHSRNTASRAQKQLPAGYFQPRSSREAVGRRSSMPASARYPPRSSSGARSARSGAGLQGAKDISNSIRPRTSFAATSLSKPYPPLQ